MNLIKFLKSGIIALVLTFTATFASAGGHFDANNHDASMLSEPQLKAMVEEAMKVNPPKNGKNYVFGFANLQRDIAFCALVEEGILANAEAAGIEILVTDNLLEYSVKLVAKTRPNTKLAPEIINNYIEWGAGPRASQYIIMASKCHAAINGKYAPDIEDVKKVAKPILRHRVVRNYKAEAEGISIDNIIEEIL